MWVAPACLSSHALLQNGGDTNYAVDIDETKLDMEDGILTNDVRGVIRPALKELKIAIMRRTSEFRQACVCVCVY